MRNWVVPVFMALLSIMFWTTGCTDKKIVAEDSTSVDSSTVDTFAVDTLDKLITEQQMPKAADELFDDFIFNFAANHKLQLKRIKFPLKLVAGDEVSYLKKPEWKMEHFFMEQGYYTLILDNAKQLRSVKYISIKTR